MSYLQPAGTHTGAHISWEQTAAENAKHNGMKRWINFIEINKILSKKFNFTCLHFLLFSLLNYIHNCALVKLWYVLLHLFSLSLLQSSAKWSCSAGFCFVHWSCWFRCCCGISTHWILSIAAKYTGEQNERQKLSYSIMQICLPCEGNTTSLCCLFLNSFSVATRWQFVFIAS